MSAPTRTPEDGRPVVAFLGCSLIWGSTFLVIQIGNDALPPTWAATLRLAVALTVLLALLRALRVPFPRGAALRAAAAFGALNFGVSFVLLYWGETRVPSGLTAVIYATIPLTTSLFARGFRLERLARGTLAGAGIALAGVAAIFSGSLGGALDPLALGAVAVAASCAALSGVLLKRGPRQHPLGANAAGAAVGLPICLAASVVAGEAHPLPTSWAAAGPVLYLALAGSIGAFGLYAWLVNRWPVSKISFVAVLVPVIAVALGATVRGERLSAVEASGALLVLAGLGVGVLTAGRAPSR